MDPEAILDDLTKLSLQKRFKESLVDDLSIRSSDDLDNYVRDFQIDDSISECFVSDTETTSRHMKQDEPIRSGGSHKQNGRKHISDLFKRKSKDTTKSHYVKETKYHKEKENIYFEMKSCIPKTALLNSLPSQDILNEDISDEDDYVLPTQYQPFERISNLIRQNRLSELVI
ncbi:hypothetical protein LOTGIDRAFT_168135 [Lottia gigantea]|uniref:Uncharacterized protein n=1 Tax=Lottia gigantea TaxID=225164 RepID=V4B8L8_LOTGI|nr:hypothetical protein LOTGIDRAFT_168135 [Lottia gigantea]ESO85109.1 hypothetical protein LOTGIDRAFT_168135 [Lottia gigantea]